ncbi:MAG: tetratricopeptide repeat protein [Vicinamibacterales bacterium]
MRRLFLVFFVALALPGLARGQMPEPTRQPAEMTPAHEALIKEGMGLHDQGQFDQAAAKYREVLAESPSNVVALFELSYAQLAQQEFDQVLETARQGVGFKSTLLPMFYDMMASAYEGKGQPQQAIETYQQGIARAPDAALLYHNMAVTYRERLHDTEGTRQALKKAASLAPRHPGIQLFLAKAFEDGGYSTPALLALSTYLTYEPYGAQSLDAYSLWRALLREPLQPSNGAEGDFPATDRFIVVSNRQMRARIDEGTSEVASLVQQVEAVFATLRVDPDASSASFTGTHYVPFFMALREQHFVDVFVYWASQRAPVEGVREWLTSNQDRVRQFLEWATQYPWPNP